MGGSGAPFLGFLGSLTWSDPENFLFGVSGYLTIDLLELHERIPLMSGEFRLGEWLVQPQLNLLVLGEQAVRVEPKVMDVLVYMAGHAGEVLPKERIIGTVWADAFVGDEALTYSISELRKALSDDARSPRFIQTIPRRGYRLIAPVSFPEKEPAHNHGDHQPARSITPLFVSAAVVVLASVVLLLWRGPSASSDDPVPGSLGLQVRPPGVTFESVDTLAPAPLTTYPEIEGEPSLCPDGRHVVFFRGNQWFRGNLWVKQVGFEEAKAFPITTSGRDHSPAWSPDEHTIAFMRSVGEQTETVMSILSLGGAAHPLLEVQRPPGLVFGRFLAWTPDGRWLIVSGYPSSDHGRGLIAFSPTTKGIVRLTRTPAPYIDEYDPAVSPDGRTLAFVRVGNSGFGAVFTLELQEDMSPQTVPRQVTDTSKQIRGLTWSTNGEEIIYAAGVMPRLRLWRLKVSEPQDPQLLSFAGPGAADPDLSRRGHRLVYEQFLAEKSIYRSSMQDGRIVKTPESFVSPSSRWDEGPMLSRDGDSILFMSDRSGTREIWICDRDGENLRKLTSFGGTKVGGATFSPNGQQIVFFALQDGQGEIYTMDADGGSQRNLTQHPADDDGPSWSLDGNWIFFNSNREPAGIWKIPASGGKAIPVDGREIGTSTDGNWTFHRGYTKAWKVPAEGGDSVEIPEIEGTDQTFHQIIQDKMFFVVMPHMDLRPFSIRSYDLRTGEVETVTTIDKHFGFGFAVSPDATSIFYTAFDRTGNDLMLVENFR